MIHSSTHFSAATHNDMGMITPQSPESTKIQLGGCGEPLNFVSGHFAASGKTLNCFTTMSALTMGWNVLKKREANSSS